MKHINYSVIYFTKLILTKNTINRFKIINYMALDIRMKYLFFFKPSKLFIKENPY